MNVKGKQIARKLAAGIKAMDTREINALIRLLDDNDNEVYTHIEGKLLSYGKEVIPFLEDAWGYSFDATLQQRIIDIIHKIQFDILKQEMENWAKSPEQDLLKGALLMSHYQYPDLDEAKILQQIDKIRRDAWLEMNDNLTALEKVGVLNHIFYEVYGFSGNTTNYHAPQNSFINVVLESKNRHSHLRCEPAGALCSRIHKREGK